MISTTRTWPLPSPNLDDMAFGVPEHDPMSDAVDAMLDMADSLTLLAIEQAACSVDPEASGEPFIQKSE